MYKKTIGTTKTNLGIFSYYTQIKRDKKIKKAQTISLFYSFTLNFQINKIKLPKNRNTQNYRK